MNKSRLFKKLWSVINSKGIFTGLIFSPIHILIFALILSGCGELTLAEKKPNVLFILVDDLGIRDLSYTGSSYYETPNVDKIAKSGMVFTQGYAASRVCSPSRASIMTGQFTATHGVTDWIGAKSGKEWRKNGRHDILLPAAYNHELASSEETLAEVLRDQGYMTFYAGKWHIGGEGSYPEDHGFTINKGGWEKGSPMGGYYSPWENPKLPNRYDGESLTMRIAKETEQFIETYKDTSFMAFMSFYAVHGPIQTTREKWRKYRDKAHQDTIAKQGFAMERILPIRQVQDNPVYAGLVETMDDAVGLVLDQLEDLGLDQNTIVIFTSDNGGVASGDSYSTSNLPYRGGKGYQWEGGIRSPYLIYVPWMNHQGTENNTPVSGIDFYPTLLDLLDLKSPNQQAIDGVSLKPLLEGGEIEERDLYWHYPHYGNQGGNPSSILRNGPWKMIHYWEDGHNELYNLETDPWEQNDISSNNQERTQELKKRLESWLRTQNANTPTIDSNRNEQKALKRKDEIRRERWPLLEQRRLDYLADDFDPQNNWWGSQVTID